MTATMRDNAKSIYRRARISLDGLWDFSFEGPTARLAGDGHAIRSPGIWQAQFPALRTAPGTGSYRRKIEVPRDWAGQRIVLVMEGVFHESVVLVDDIQVASHGDGWTSIEVDLSDVLDGKALFVLGVNARTPDDRDGGRFSRSLAGKQD
ncbi:MAG: sugar-binding domain-containing protein, partial [Roseiarcus sp.]